jgi:hypothetical protein
MHSVARSFEESGMANYGSMSDRDRIEMAARHEKLAEENEELAQKSSDPSVQQNCRYHASEHRRKVRMYLQLR